MSIPKIFIRSAYNYDGDLVSNETGFSSDEVTLTHQSFREEADINVIVKRYGINDALPTGMSIPSYADFTGVTDYRDALDLINAGNIAFSSMPADVRSRFNNDASLFVEHFNAISNRSEGEALGLVFNEPAPADVVEGGAPPKAEGG
ncbi:MAG: internal scaffolding protein [Microviridae sp.]|nr:MAG: internal scaffolding protein [Microviridae sp.]